jgi:hypothetical protein
VVAVGVDPFHEQGTHHWIIVLDGVGCRSGTCSPAPGETRYDWYLKIRALVLDEEGMSDGPVPVTLDFDIQLNSLAAA